MTSFQVKETMEESIERQLQKMIDIGSLSLKNVGSEDSLKVIGSRQVVKNPTKPDQSNAAKRKQFQSKWLHLLQQPLSQSQHERIIEHFTDEIIDGFSNPAMLLDYFTNAYDMGSKISILALNSVWAIMKRTNLDYPSFYPKLYSLFDDEILHSPYKSRFFKMADLFLSSTHISSNIVAAFIKRMARLSLSAPPSSILIILALTYNLLKSHPTCMKMIHRPDTFLKKDPFNMEEEDPAKSGALESSLWEISMHVNHYHPAVSSLAEVYSQPFKKKSYRLDKYIDGSYSSMIDAEMKRSSQYAPTIQEDQSKDSFTSQNSLILGKVIAF